MLFLRLLRHEHMRWSTHSTNTCERKANSRRIRTPTNIIATPFDHENRGEGEVKCGLIPTIPQDLEKSLHPQSTGGPVAVVSSFVRRVQRKRTKESVSGKVDSLRDPSNYIVSTINKGFVPKQQY